MNPATLNTSAQFFSAAASYYGIPPDQLVLGGQVGSVDGVFAITLQIALTPADLIGIIKRMAMLNEERAGKALDDFLGQPRAGMTPAKSAEFDAEGLTGTWRGKAHEGEAYAAAADAFARAVEENSEGVAGRTVVHADVPEEDGNAGLPASVWVKRADLAHMQIALSSDHRPETDEYLVHLDMLTARQREQYGVAS